MTILADREPFVRAGSATPLWRRELRAAVRDPHELCRLLELPAAVADSAVEGVGQFSLFVPPHYLSLIRRGDPHDPLLRQVLPIAEESRDVSGFTADPVDDAAAARNPGVLKKYEGRALLIATGVCAVHCRYCFRRHFPYADIPHSDTAWDTALQAIAADSTIGEVILSGGDPLMLADERLARLVEQIAGIAHVKRLRVHTRLPLMVPARVTDSLIEWLTSTRLTPIMVLHANHAQELDDLVAQSLESLRTGGVMLLNQSVLLRGVNDSVAALVALSERLIELGVVPYYLHQLDRVAGAAHFEVPVAVGRQLVTQLQARLPGYAVPRYVQEVPEAVSKVPLL